MKDAKYNSSMGATAGCTLRLLEGSCGIGSNGNGMKGDAWFGSVRAAMEIGVRGHECILQVKSNSSLYPKDFIKKALDNAPGGVSIVLQGTAPNEVPLIAIGYRYSVKTTLFFIMTSKAGSTKPGAPYLMKYTDGFGNLMTREVERPAVISDYFRDSNTIDRHNQSRQHDLALEEAWLTKKCWFRLTCSLIGIHVTDTWKLADYHGMINFGKKAAKKPLTIQRFAGILGHQLILNAAALSNSAVVSRFASASVPQPISVTLPGVVSAQHTATTQETISSVSDPASNPSILIPIRSIADCCGNLHHQVKLPLQVGRNGKRYTKQRPCKFCKQTNVRRDCIYYCFTCGLSASFCCPTERCDRDCFKAHVTQIQMPAAVTRSRSGEGV